MNEALVPRSVAEDDDDVVIALETARVEEERGDRSEAARWLQRAASAARKQGRPERAGEVSRLAARLTGSPSASSTPPPPDVFEPLPGEAQVLSDADEDFSDTTIVDALPRAQAGSLAAPRVPAVESTSTGSVPPPPPQRSSSIPRPALSPTSPSALRPTSTQVSTQLSAQVSPSSPSIQIGKPTPLAPLGPRAGATHPAVRVAVRKILGGKLEARPLEAEEAPLLGEEEALLVAVRPGAKLF